MPGRVEFLDPDPGPNDVATGPGPRRRPPNRRRTVLVLAVLAAVVVGLLVTRAASTDDAPTAVPSPTRGVSAVPGVLPTVLDTPNGEAVATYCAGDPDLPGSIDPTPTPSPRIRPTGGRQDRALALCPQDASFCPGTDTGQPGCGLVDSVPPGVLQAVRKQYPGATLAVSSTEITRTHRRLWYRLLVFAIGRGSTLRVDVIQRQNTFPGDGEREDASGLVARAVHADGSFATLVTFGRPGGSATDFTVLARLAADAELRAID